MHTMLRHFAAASILLAAATAAHATTYDFSYHFINGDVVSGSFDGTASGNLVSNLTNTRFSINGVGAAYPVYPGSLTYPAPAVFSFDGLANNFLLIDGLASTFLLSGAFDGSATTNVINYSTPQGRYAAGPGSETYSPSRWSLTSTVPEPATCTMLLGGLALLGAVARRRQAPHRNSLSK